MKPSQPAATMPHKKLASYTDLSVLKPDFTITEVRHYLQEGIDMDCHMVCINPAYIGIARDMCAEVFTGVCVVCDFPFGTSSTASKASQATLICRQDGVEELDVVANYGFIRSGWWDDFYTDVETVVQIAHGNNILVKVIIETDALTPDEIILATEFVCKTKADFIVSSTDFFSGSFKKGATPEVIRLMIQAAGGRVKIKGSGSICTREQFLELIDMGIDRMGISYLSMPSLLGKVKKERVFDLFGEKLT